MQPFNVSNCVENLSVSDPEIVLITNLGVFSEYIFYEDINFTYGFSSSPVSYGNNFVTTWDTRLTSTGSSNSTTITLPLDGGGSYSFDIDWGDGTQEYISSSSATHNYASSGIYNITINGTVVGFIFNNAGDRNKLLDVKNWGCLGLLSGGYYFRGAENMIVSATDTLNLSGTTSLDGMFYGAFNLTGDFSSWDTSGINTMIDTFREAGSFNGNISTWDTSSVTSMDSTFRQATLFNQPIGGWDVSNVISLSETFYNADIFNQPLNDWDVYNVSNLGSMFRGADAFDQDLDQWNTSSVTDISDIFYGADAFNGNISTWDISSVTDMSNIFRNAFAFNQDLSSWNVSGVTLCTNFNLSATSWLVSNQPTFSSCTP